MKNFRSIYCVVLALMCSATIFNADASPPKGIQNILLVHGALVDGSTWDAVASQLIHDGYHVTILQNPNISIAQDSEIIKRAIRRQVGPVIMVAHSFGGVTVSEAAADEAQVKGIIYVSALMVDQGETAGTLLARGAAMLPPDVEAQKAFTPDSQGFITISNRDFWRTHVAADISERAVNLLVSKQGEMPVEMYSTPLNHAAWRSKPTWMIIPDKDRTVVPELNRFMAKRANSTVVEVPGASHLFFMEHPQVVIKTIETVANALNK